LTGILIVGGGRLQLYAIQRAHELGLTTYLVDGDINCPSRRAASFFYNISTKDSESVANLAKRLAASKEIRGVYTQGTDVEFTVAVAADRAKLPGITPESAKNCQDKYLTRSLLAKHKISRVKFLQVKTEEEWEEVATKVGLPCFIKPADNSASRGATRVTTVGALRPAIREALEMCTNARHAIAEQEILGSEHSVDTILEGGRLYAAGISDRIFLPKNDYAVQIGSRTPSALPSQVQARMYKIMADAASALGIDWGAFKGDLAWDAATDHVEIIEVTARTSGGYDSQLRKPLSFGIDLLKATIEQALGRGLDCRDLIPRWVAWSETSAIFPEPGTVLQVKGFREAVGFAGVADVEVFVKPGDVIPHYKHSANRTNVFTCVGDTPDQLATRVAGIRDTISISTRP